MKVEGRSDTPFGKFVTQVTPDEGGGVTLRVDHTENLAFWLTIKLSPDELEIPLGTIVALLGNDVTLDCPEGWDKIEGDDPPCQDKQAGVDPREAFPPLELGDFGYAD